MLKSQKNHIFHMVVQAGLDPREFEWDTMSGAWAGYDDEVKVPRLVHRATGFYCAFAGAGREHEILHTPGSGTERMHHEHLLEGDIYDVVDFWLGGCLRSELEEPDLWGELKNGKDLADLVQGVDDNKPFTHEERARIAETLDAILRQVTETHELSAGQTQLLEARFAELKTATARLGRRDWVGVLAGAVVGLVLEAALSSDVARNLWRLVGEGLRWLVEHAPSLPPPGGIHLP